MELPPGGAAPDGAPPSSAAPDGAAPDGAPPSSAAPDGAFPARSEAGPASGIPAERPLEDPTPEVSTSIEGLPPVEIPPSMLAAAAERKTAGGKRQRRLVIEVAGGGAIAAAGLLATMITRSPNALAVTILAVLVLVAYEVLVSVLE